MNDYIDPLSCKQLLPDESISSIEYSIEGIDPALCECVFSPAKRRGPVPGRTGTTRKASEVFGRPMSNGMDGAEWQSGGNTMGGIQSMEELQLRQMMLQNMAAGPGGMPPGLAGGLGGVQSMDTSGAGFLDPQQAAIQQQLNLIQQLQAQQNMVERNNVAQGGEQPAAQRMKLDKPSNTDANGVPRTIASHTHLLELSDPDGSRLRSYYRLSVDEIFGFPPTPTDEEYCIRLNIPGMTPRMIPGTHLAALSAARFAEVALGAIVHNEVTLGMELCNAVVHCLRESVQEPVQPPYMFEVARSYFLLGVFRAFRGDMIRYFKYRRVCLTYISKLDVSFL